MYQSKHSLHRPIALNVLQKTQMSRTVAELVQKRAAVDDTEAQAAFSKDPLDTLVATPTSYSFPITTVSMNYSFDAYISVGFFGANPANAPSLIVDSGNTTLIVPRWEDISAIPNYQATYQVLAQTTEPWGCPANVVKGPILLFPNDGNIFNISDCVFYACTGNSPKDQTRTANFGAGCIAPWIDTWSDPATDLNGVLQPALSQTAYPYIEFDYASMDRIPLASTIPATSTESMLRIYNTMPSGYQMFDIIPNCCWMALTPKNLGIAGTPTQWPGNVGSPIAMIDTGGGPVFLSDPSGFLYPNLWPSPVSTPCWASSSINCQSTQALLNIVIGDDHGVYSYTIDPMTFPTPAQGLTLVICEENAYMMGQQGMNVGGISALANSILVDFKNNKVGLKKR